MAKKQVSLSNEQTKSFRIVSASGAHLGYINISDDLDSADYKVVEDNLVNLIETKQITIAVKSFDEGSIASGFVLS